MWSGFSVHWPLKWFLQPMSFGHKVVNAEVPWLTVCCDNKLRLSVTAQIDWFPNLPRTLVSHKRPSTYHIYVYICTWISKDIKRTDRMWITWSTRYNATFCLEVLGPGIHTDYILHASSNHILLKAKYTLSWRRPSPMAVAQPAGQCVPPDCKTCSEMTQWTWVFNLTSLCILTPRCFARHVFQSYGKRHTLFSCAVQYVFLAFEYISTRHGVALLWPLITYDGWLHTQPHSTDTVRCFAQTSYSKAFLKWRAFSKESLCNLGLRVNVTLFLYYFFLWRSNSQWLYTRWFCINCNNLINMPYKYLFT